jgi:integrase
MPSAQTGFLTKRGDRWSVRFRDLDGKHRRQTFGSGREGKAEAAAWLAREVERVEALRRGDTAAVRRAQIPTLAELVDEYVGQHSAEANTLRTLRERLSYATKGPGLDGQGGFGAVRIDRLQVHELGAWRKRLPERSAWAIVKALRQVLNYAVRAGLLDENPAKRIPNPELRAAQALSELPPRLDTPLLFPGARGGHLNLNKWRSDEWTPAVRAAGLTHRPPYSLRHTFASFSIAAGVSLFELARFMGTSVEQIDRTYGHLLPDSLERARAALDSFVAQQPSDVVTRAGV